VLRGQISTALTTGASGTGLLRAGASGGHLSAALWSLLSWLAAVALFALVGGAILIQLFDLYANVDAFFRRKS
jgi:hypothetical protein